MNRKLKSNAGETLVETLFSLLVIGLAMTMLAGAIMAAARVNKGARDFNTAFILDNAEKVSSSVTVKISGKTPISVSVNAYRTQNQYYYYTSVPSAG